MKRRLAVPRQTSAFTLVELLVVIAIIGVLVALLLPAIQAAREAARRGQCANNVKQMMLSIHNHESAMRVFPSGGVAPWPNLANYIGTNGSPLGPERQGLSWAFQILPYLEGQSTYHITNQTQLQETIVPMYSCPSRRPPTQSVVANAYLMDYAAADAFSSRGDIGPNMYTNALKPMPDWGTKACNAVQFWSGTGGPRFEDEIAAKTTAGKTTAESMGSAYVPRYGVIVRSNYCATCPAGKQITGFYTKVSFNQIVDGSSNTLVIGEKRVLPSLYSIGDWHDDRGWTDGWDPDTLRSTVCVPGPDVDSVLKSIGYEFGSAHTAGFTAGFADASVRTLRYDIDIDVFNCLGHRADGQTIDPESL